MTYKIAVCDDEKIFIDDVVTKLNEQGAYNHKVSTQTNADFTL